MRKLLLLAVIVIAAVLGWLFFTGEGDPEMDALRDDTTAVAQQIGDRLSDEAQSVRNRIMADNGVELHSAATALTVAEPSIADIRYHAWQQTGDASAPYTSDIQWDPASQYEIYVTDDHYAIRTGGSPAQAGSSKSVENCETRKDNPDGSSFVITSGSGGFSCWDILKLANDKMVLQQRNGLYEFSRMTGDGAKTVQTAFEAQIAAVTAP